MRTTTLEKVESDTRTFPADDNGDHDRFSHYFLRNDLDKAFLDGVPIQALCGKWDVPTRDFTKFPVCPTCREIYSGIPDGPSDD